MVNSPVLFNLFIFKVLNKIENIIFFANDIIIYHADNTIENINQNVQKTFHVLEKLLITDWIFKINSQKCETLLFRPPVNKFNYNIKKNCKLFVIKSDIDNAEIPNH